MKKIVFLFVFILPLLAFSQDVLKFTEVVTVDSSLKKYDLFEIARSWLNKNFVSSKEVIQISDKVSGELSAKGCMKFDSKYFNCARRLSGYIWFTVNITVKDGRYKYEFIDFKHEGSQDGAYGPINLGIITNDSEYPYNDLLPMVPIDWYTKRWIEVKEKINLEIPHRITVLKASMTKKANSDW